ncbi:transposase, partial [Candidatus Ozemobacteraceae bacterium]|nr:transposase [Candidatus Ozemobacteraceae bacterium]
MQVVSIFPNEESVIRLIAALLIETHEDYANSNRYNNGETILALAPEDDVYRIRRCSSLFHSCGRRNRPGEYHFKNRPPAAPE